MVPLICNRHGIGRRTWIPGLDLLLSSCTCRHRGMAVCHGRRTSLSKLQKYKRTYAWLMVGWLQLGQPAEGQPALSCGVMGMYGPGPPCRRRWRAGRLGVGVGGGCYYPRAVKARPPSQPGSHGRFNWELPGCSVTSTQNPGCGLCALPCSLISRRVP